MTPPKGDRVQPRPGPLTSNRAIARDMLDAEPKTPPPTLKRCAVMLDRGDGLFEVAVLDLDETTGTFTEHWRNFPQMVHFAVGEVTRQTQMLLATQMTRHVGGVPAPMDVKP